MATAFQVPLSFPEIHAVLESARQTRHVPPLLLSSYPTGGGNPIPSSWQVDEHPSPLVWLPSSHSSPPSVTLLPQHG